MEKFIRGSEWRRWDLHLHTASSYDSTYKGIDSDELLCNSLRKNEIAAVAITDHFKIDADRIYNLRKIAPDIVFFPGIELRTDKGATNLHVIIIFPETEKLEDLSNDFHVSMWNIKAKSNKNNDTVYWDFNDIVDFSNRKNGLISMHAGGKASGLDREITNALPINMAIKQDISEQIDIFEISKQKDIEDYKNKVFPEIGVVKPLVICSDSHDPRNYEVKERLWIKADLTFGGLRQSVLQPEERIFIGNIPPNLDNYNKSKQKYIRGVQVHRIEDPKNLDVCWFDFNIPFNIGLTSIIGNKGSGKSALSDITGHFANSHTMKYGSFLNDDRFRKPDKKYAQDYEGSLTWYDGKEEEKENLEERIDSELFPQKACYLPQKYIEEVCNNLEETFQSEVYDLIFSYLDYGTKGNSLNLTELLNRKSEILENNISNYLDQLYSINDKIINLEKKKTKSYFLEMTNNIKHLQDKLARHNQNKPQEVLIPETYVFETDGKIKQVKNELEEVKKRIEEVNNIIVNSSERIDSLKKVISKLDNFSSDIDELNRLLKSHMISTIDTNINEIREKVTLKVCELNNNIKNYCDLIDENNMSDENLNVKKDKLDEQYHNLINSKDESERNYQKYLDDLQHWEDEKNEIIGNEYKERSLKYYEKELEYIENKLISDYKGLLNDRFEITKNIYELKKEIVSIYSNVYTSASKKIINSTIFTDINLDFVSELDLVKKDIGLEFLELVNKRYTGMFYGLQESNQLINKIIKRTNFNDWDSVSKFLDELMNVVYEDMDLSSKKVNKEEYYNKLWSLDYIIPRFNIKVEGKNIQELSPGEKGIVLLIFYLTLSKDDAPLIIDQPEDNLDNQSVYKSLVPCILDAKKRRQIIIVTHNPNIAVACDSEEVIVCNMDKLSNSISYISGSLENPDIKKHIVDILEGTKPAFDLRSQNYLALP